MKKKKKKSKFALPSIKIPPQRKKKIDPLNLMLQTFTDTLLILPNKFQTSERNVNKKERAGVRHRTEKPKVK